MCNLTGLRGVELADHDHSSDGGKINIQIGLDYYWEMFWALLP